MTDPTFRAPADRLRSTDPLARRRVALVAGGGLSGPLGGIGFAIAWLVVREGASVAVLDRDPDAGARTVQMLRDLGADAEFFAVNMTDDADAAAGVAAVVARPAGSTSWPTRSAAWGSSRRSRRRRRSGAARSI
ncbi:MULTISPECIES: SDR family NAD(P)-dependent oxidoreductase [unclassified Microbacterium]|uniref:SDR family NAD(P)-dependent oxidoreductase n=1 Tax=unclassified Microbacterium TaxID=2609290 RepID=UPI00214C5D19|nr:MULTISPECIES: SDR family NAD(P)-dependent oxidoreductase [unclassified Microbacterium]MCR2808410.1 SDR family NAD(P)-dependent oxidoreductase [Microbacterium sp. zg.B185]WIM19144.1 SDR family NAD(P)-dependent oxidoreductase [Microbacterium sp. zg-B185]